MIKETRKILVVGRIEPQDGGVAMCAFITPPVGPIFPSVIVAKPEICEALTTSVAILVTGAMLVARLNTINHRLHRAYN